MTTFDYNPTTGPSTGDANRPSGPAEPGSSGGTADQAREAASTAAEESRHVAAVAKDEARHVAADAQAHARDLLGEARTEVEQQTRSQLDSLVGTLQGFAEDLEKMARGESAGSGLAQDVVQQVGDRARAFSAQLRDREPTELLDQARSYARRKPGTFLVGALAAGVVAGRLTRGAKESQGSQGSQGSSPGSQGSSPETGTLSTSASFPTSSDPEAGTAAGTPLADTGEPETMSGAPEGSTASQWGTP